MTRIAIATLMFFALFEPEVQAASTLWLCGLTEDGVRLACVADADPSSAGEAPPALSLSVNGTAFPLDPRRVYFVDLWSPPTEMEFVEQLARSTICYRSPGCKVVMTTDRRAATAQNKWPTLNSVSSPSTAKISAAMP
jgi:hypothetical protein